MDTILVNNVQIPSSDTIEILYESPEGGDGTIITAFTAANCITTSVSYKGYIVPSGGSPDCPVIPLKIVVRDRFDSGPSIVNQVIPPGGTLRAENSTGDGLNFYVTGREQ